MIASVIIDIKHEKVNKIYDYFVPIEDESFIKKGMRVIVPFTDNDIKRMALVVDLKKNSLLANKYIDSILDIEPIFSDEYFMMIDQLLFNPGTLLSNAVQTVLPNNLKIQYEKTVKVLDKTLLPEAFKSKFNRNNLWKLKKSDSVYYHKLSRLKEQNIIEIKTVLKSRNKVPKKSFISLEVPEFIGTLKQNIVIDYLKLNGIVERKELNQVMDSSVIRRLLEKGVIKETLKTDSLVQTESLDRTLLDEFEFPKINIKNLFKQAETYVVIGDVEKRNHLLNHLITHVLNLDKQILILLPETFMVGTFITYVSNIFKSELIIDLAQIKSDKDLNLKHEAIKQNEAKIIVGNRKDVFTDFHDLGAIYLSEYTDNSYVPFEGIYYDTKKIAALRSQYHDIPLFLADQFVSVASYNAIDSKKAKQLILNQDEEKPVILVDMKQELLKGNTKLISTELKKQMDDALNQDEKVLLIMNQKGYAPFVMCRSCSYVPLDPTTHIPLTYHEKDHMLRSNLTKYEIHFSKTCEQCKKDTVKPVGSGIEQLELYLEKVYPDIKVLRIDSDKLNNKQLYKEINELKSGKMIIIGTQMALKSSLTGKVSLVAILMSDQWLKIPRYDAYETAYYAFMKAKSLASKTFLIQGYDLSNFVINSIKLDDDSFYKRELENRKLSNLPPYKELLQIRLEGESYLKTFKYGQFIKHEAYKLGINVLGPTPSLLLKKYNKYRVLLSVKYDSLDQSFIETLKNNQDIDVYTHPDIIWY